MARYELTDAQWDRIAYFFPHPTHGPGPVILGIRTAPWSTASFGISTRGHRATFPLSMALGKRSMIASTGGARTVLGPESSPPCSTSWMMRGGSAENCGASMLRSFEPVVRLRGPENSPLNRVHWAATRRRNSKSQKAMVRDVRGEALAPRFTWSVIVMGLCWRSLSRQANSMKSMALRGTGSISHPAPTQRKGRCRWPSG